jgi:glycosyltransferase involved in cell wall biosynthesis
MNVVHVEAGRHLYGGALQVLYLLRGLRERPGRNVLVCPQGSALAEAARGVADVVHPIPMGGELDLGLVPRLLGLLRRERPDLVHLHSRRGADLWGALAARRAGVPVVLSRRVDNPEPRWLVGLKYRLYDHVVTISEAIRQVLIAEGVAPDRVTCVPSAVDTEAYRPGCEDAWFRAEFGLAPAVPVIGMVAQFIDRKGHGVLIEAAPPVLAAYPEARFLLFGQGPLKAACEDQARRRGLTRQVLFPGFRRDLARVLPCLTLLVHPALLEGLGVSLLQAAACGVPTVASAVGGIPEAVRDGVTGALVPPGDPDALAEAVRALLADPERRRAQGANGRRHALERFSPAAMVEGNSEVYARVLAGRG